MSDTASGQCLALLAHAVDEMGETVNLLPVAQLSRSVERSRLRKVFFAFARSQNEVAAGYSAQYLDHNLVRARAHWREALAMLAEACRVGANTDVVSVLADDLPSAGIEAVLSQLQIDAIPSGSGRAGAHLAAVVGRIRDCQQLVITARSKLTLQQMRDQAATD